MPAENFNVHLTAPTGNTAEHVATSTTQPTQLAGSKRKSTHTSDLPTINLDDYDIPDGEPMDSCTVVRGKINRFLEAGEMKVGQFCDAIGVSGNAYRRFMSQNRKFAGEQSDTYRGAWEFFKKREMAGLKIPTKKQKVAASGGASGSSTAAAAAEKDKDAHPDISNIHLDGEETDSVQVYDTCDEVRKKISAYLRKPNTTAAQFCRDLLAQYHTDEKKPSRIQSTQLTKFRGYKGADTGNTSCVFYAAYVFFEKVRLAEGKPKSKHRLKMEEIWGGKGGFDVSRGHHRGYLVTANERPVQDQYGRVTFQRTR
ncbi:hypothetical protein M436DRAFT_52268 [Aureobasidium namibiae CBS 147.97]|uniref:DUF7726 domain-containing protein n=1 Tax=Aureobasidium namibiae CBS 147.97 TaxID=1043004 RepID=A0A074WCP8_9PEZI